MDQIKIGKFIAECRKKQNLTQMQLAEKLNITDRAVSKWERGISMPDSALMLELCAILDITVNDLLNGEIVSMDKYSQELENTLLDAIKQKEESDKRLLRMELVMGLSCLIPILVAAVLVAVLKLEEWLGTVIVLSSLLPLLIFTPFALRIEQKTGYYQCAECKHKYVPAYKSVFFASHMGTTRYMKCPNCHKKSWQKKVLGKDE